MNKKFMIALAVSMLSSQIIAHTGHDYKIISEKETINGSGVIGGSIDVTDSKKKSFRQAQALARAKNSSAKVNQKVRLDGYHEIGIKNNWNSTQQYSFGYALSQGNDRYDYIKTVELKPGGVFVESRESFLMNVSRNQPGVYEIVAKTYFTSSVGKDDRGTAKLVVTR